MRDLAVIEAKLAGEIWQESAGSLERRPPPKDRVPESVEEDVAGIRWCPTKRTWRVQVKVNGVRHNKYKATHADAVKLLRELTGLPAAPTKQEPREAGGDQTPAAVAVAGAAAAPAAEVQEEAASSEQEGVGQAAAAARGEEDEPEGCLPSPSSPAWRSPPMPSSWRGKPAVQGPGAGSSRPVSRLAVKGNRPPAHPPAATGAEARAAATSEPSTPLRAPIWRTSRLPRLVKQLQLYTEIYDGFLPGDLEDMVSRRQRSADLYTAAPALVFICAHLKYGPVRDAFEEQVRKQMAGGSNPRTAAVLHRVLVDMLPRVIMHKAGLSAWSEHCGVNVAHHSGYLAWLGKLGVLERQDGPSPRTVQLGQLGSHYTVNRRGSPELFSQLQGYLNAAEAVRVCQLRPPGS